MCIAFLASKENKLNAGELTERSFRDYYRSCHLFAELIGKYRRVDDLRPDDFERLRTKMAERFGPVTLCNEINRCRVVLKFAFDQGLIAAPVRYGRTVVRQTVGEGVAYGTPCSWSANV